MGYGEGEGKGRDKGEEGVGQELDWMEQRVFE